VPPAPPVPVPEEATAPPPPPVAVAVALTVFYQQPLRRDPVFWAATRMRRASANTIAVVSLCVWVGIVFAGRWIAYAIDG